MGYQTSLKEKPAFVVPPETLPSRSARIQLRPRTAAFGDVMGGLTTAGAIAAALLKRERTGEPSIVDVSLLATAMWQLSPMVIASKLFGFSKIPQGDRTKNPNPGVGNYRTKDDRFIALMADTASSTTKTATESKTEDKK